MNTTVSLQDAFSYALWPIIVLGSALFIIASILVGLHFYRKYKHRKPKPKPVKVVAKQVNIQALKAKYLRELEKLEHEFSTEKITLRQAYQQISVVIRRFVFEATGIKVQNYTLDEIKTAHMPSLEALVAEYYSPEFAKQSKGDFMESLGKTKKVIEQWK